ncbi:MAG: ribosome silencing factor [Alphaproteobacteria bacterium]|nr:ribosome silencing factor [Alphaproteobacteria bacterium]
MTSALLTVITETLAGGKAEEINTITLAGKNDMADYLVIASGNSSRHVNALARQVLDALALQGIKGIRPEGGSSDEWIVIDVFDIVVHLFSPQMRQFYDLDQMWQDPPLLQH